MKNYQVIGLIGTTIGILLMLGLLATLGFLGSLGADLEREGTPVFMAGVLFASVFYIAALTVLFVASARHSKAVGAMLILIGLFTTFITNGWGIIPFALLLPAGIVAIRYKRQEVLGITTTAAGVTPATTTAGNNNDGGGDEGRKGNHKEVVRDSKSGIYYTKD